MTGSDGDDVLWREGMNIEGEVMGGTVVLLVMIGHNEWCEGMNVNREGMGDNVGKIKWVMVTGYYEPW